MRILITTLGSYGDINPFLALGKSLAARGHEVAIATSDMYRSDIGRQGLGYFPMRPHTILSKEDFRKLMDPRKGSECVVKEYVMPHLRGSYEDLEAAAKNVDFLVSHMITYATPVLAEKKRIPWVSTVLQPLTFFSAYDPPVLSPAPWLSRLRPLGPIVNRPLMYMLEKFSLSWGEPVQKLRKSLGLPRAKNPLIAGQHSPYGVLALFSKALADPQPDWPPHTSITGFAFHDEDFHGKPVDLRLEEFLKNGPEPICFTLGSSAVHVADDFFETAIEACRKTGRRAVLVGGEAAEKASQMVSENAIAVPSAPYHWLFPKCSAIVHQCGIGTLGHAMRSGRPQILVPFSHDQFDNADRIARRGAGIVMKRSGLSSRKLSGKIEELHMTSSYSQNAQKIGKIVGAENGTEAAARAIEDILQTRDRYSNRTPTVG